MNVYAPNKTSEHNLSSQHKDELDNMCMDENCSMIVGGDFNVIMDPKLDGYGGNPRLKKSVKKIENICSSYDLVDIWRVRNPDTKSFTRRQKTTVVQIKGGWISG